MYSGKRYLLSDNRKSEIISVDGAIALWATEAPKNMTSKFRLSKVGFPIRKSVGQRPFAPHHSLSQRTTSFIASYRQGIHQMLLVHLIALISNAHLAHTTPVPLKRSELVRTLGMMSITQKDQKSRYTRTGAAVAARRPLRAPTDGDVR